MKTWIHPMLCLVVAFSLTTQQAFGAMIASYSANRSVAALTAGDILGAHVNEFQARIQRTIGEFEDKVHAAPTVAAKKRILLDAIGNLDDQLMRLESGKRVVGGGDGEAGVASVDAPPKFIDALVDYRAVLDTIKAVIEQQGDQITLARLDLLATGIREQSTDHRFFIVYGLVPLLLMTMILFAWAMDGSDGDYYSYSYVAPMYPVYRQPVVSRVSYSQTVVTPYGSSSRWGTYWIAN